MQRVSFFGYAKTTQALAKKIVQEKQFSYIDFFDDKVENSYQDENGFWIKNPREFDPALSSLEFPSPGFPPSHPLIKKAKNLQSEYDYFGNTTVSYTHLTLPTKRIV